MRTKAAECEEKARTGGDPRLKDMYEMLAKQWSQLADHFEKGNSP
jgi:hypothetical protein